MPNPTIALSVFLSITAVAWPQTSRPAPKTTYHPIPVTAARQENPVKPTAESLESGKKIYAYDCASCHGATGNGKTEAGKDLKLPDFTDPAALKDRTDGEVFYIVKNGHGNMPPEGDRVKTSQLWDLVNFTRSLAKKKAPEEKPAQ